jgi:hypothetical protein
MDQGMLALFNYGLLNLLTVLPCSVTPSRYRAFIQSKDMHNGLQWTAIGKQSYDDNNQFGWLAKSFQHRPSPSRKRSTTQGTTIAFSLAIMNSDIACIETTTCRTRWIPLKEPGERDKNTLLWVK